MAPRPAVASFGRPAVTMGDWRPCTEISSSGGGRDVATWRPEAATGIICISRTGTRDEACYSYHEQGGWFAVKAVSGVYYCMPGDIDVK